MAATAYDRQRLQVLATFLRTSAWLALRFGLTGAEFQRWAAVAWRQEAAEDSQPWPTV